MEQIPFAFWPPKSGTLCQRPENFQRWPASLFFSLIESTIEVGPLTKSCDIFI